MTTQTKKVEPHRIRKGQRVTITGTVRERVNRNYLRVEIHDHVCGINIAHVLIHHEAVKPKAKGQE